MRSSPCRECIVRSMCEDLCVAMRKYFREKVMNFKPGGSPVSTLQFINEKCRMIRKQPTTTIRTSLACGPDHTVVCVVIYVMDYDIVKIEEVKDE